MNFKLRMLPHSLPACVRYRILTELAEATADAFGCPIPAFGHLSSDERLRAYARFTKEQAEEALRSGRDIQTIKRQLYQNAAPLGAKLRSWLGVVTIEEVMAVGQILYRSIGVDIQGDSHGNMEVKHCIYSRFYSGSICDLMSALDDGVFSGLSGGGRLTFYERLTEGGACCRARLR